VVRNETRLMRAAAVLAAALVALGIISVVGVTAAAAATKGSDVVTPVPAPGSQLAPHSRYYELHLRPGGVATQTVVLHNDNDHPIDVHVDGIDGFTSDATGASYDTPYQKAKGTGRWIVVSTPEITLQPHEARSVDFTVRVPISAAPGQYLGGLGMYVPLTSTSTTVAANAGQATFGITLQGERIIAVEVVVPGPSRPNLQVSSITPVAAPTGMVLDVALANAGNAFANGTGVIAVDDTNTNVPFTIGTFVSHTAINYRVPWTRTVVPGDHNVSVRLSYDGRVTTWNGTVSIGGALKSNLERALHQTEPNAPAPPAAHSSSSFLVAGGTVATLACIAGAVLLRRRRRRVPALAP
jgi:hypothetical protein